MNINLPTNFGSAVTPYSTLGGLAVGEESVESKATPFKSVEEAAESAHSEGRAGSERASGLVPAGEQEQQAAQQQAQQKQQQQQDQELIGRLAARDREVRAHEQAHAAVGGQLSGSPSYEFQRGPDGVSYAVGGEVSISGGVVPNDPEATLANAQQIRRAALAPADPSAQDRAVAAGAASLELQALAQIAQQQRDEVVADREAENERRDEIQEKDELLAEERAVSEARRSESDQEAAVIQDESIDTQQNLLKRLQEIGALPVESVPGERLNLSA
jgi:hypothetical protein